MIDNVMEKVVDVHNNLADISNYVTKLDDIEKLINDKIEAATTSSTTIGADADLLARISNLESLTIQLNKKMDSLSTLKIPNPNYLPPQHVSSSYESPERVLPRPNDRPLLILGDSNTRYVNIDDSATASVRMPTMLIKDINPDNCKGFKKIWLHRHKQYEISALPGP